MLQLRQLTNCNSIRNVSDHPPLRCSLLLISFALACLTLSPRAWAVDPPPDGGYGNQNTAEGTDALFSLTSGVWNVAVGFQALHSDTDGNQNTATGYRALFSNVTGDHSAAFGSQALLHNTTGNDNVATGFSTLFTNTTGNRNTGVGFRTLLFNNADDNTAIGWNALFNNRTGIDNTAIGSGALLHNGTGGGNTANGAQALFSTTAGGDNTAVGGAALEFNTTGANNTAVGVAALFANTTGYGNIAIGGSAGFFTTGHDNIDIGNNGVSGESETTRIGDIQGQIYLAGIAGQIVGAGGTTCYVDNDGKLGVALSSRRFKTDIADMDTASEALLALRPVTFHYKPGLDKTCIPQFGLVAEEVARVNPDLVTRDAKGELSTVRYEAVNAMLLNEFLKAHRKMEEQEATITQLKDSMNILTASLKEQAAQIHKVSAELNASKAASQMVVSTQ